MEVVAYEALLSCHWRRQLPTTTKTRTTSRRRIPPRPYWARRAGVSCCWPRLPCLGGTRYWADREGTQNWRQRTSELEEPRKWFQSKLPSPFRSRRSRGILGATLSLCQLAAVQHSPPLDDYCVVFYRLHALHTQPTDYTV